jgi:hypothetical protein
MPAPVIAAVKAIKVAGQMAKVMSQFNKFNQMANRFQNIQKAPNNDVTETVGKMAKEQHQKQDEQRQSMTPRPR